MLITCPSGLSFEARRWRIEDRKVLLDRKDKRPVQRRMLEVIAGACVDPGPYEGLAAGSKVDFLKVATMDMVAALFEARVASKPMYYFDQWCDRCRTKLELEQDLGKLPKKPCTAEAIEYLKSGQPIVRTYSDIEVGYKLPLGGDLLKMEAAKDLSDQLSTSVALHICYVQLPGPNQEQLNTFEKIRRWYDSLDDWALAKTIDEEISIIEGGLDTIITQRCSNDDCAAEVSFALPLEVGFFVPTMEPRRATHSAGPSSSAGGPKPSTVSS
jgi:hypothetical protein